MNKAQYHIENVMASTSGKNSEQRYHVAISPFGKEIAILDCVTNILKTWRVLPENDEVVAIPTNFECKLRDDIGIKSDEINWSLAISDADSDGNTLIALSCFNFNKVNKVNYYKIDDNSREIDIVTENEISTQSNNFKELNSKNSNEKNIFNNDTTTEICANNLTATILNSIKIYSTRIVSTSGNEVWHKIKNFYGFLQFFQGNMLLISNHLGIVRGLCVDNKSDINYLSNSLHERKNINIYEKYWKPIYLIEKPYHMDRRGSKSKYVRFYEKYFDPVHLIDKPAYIHLDLYYDKVFNKQFKKHIINYHEQSNCNDKKDEKFYELFGYPENFIENLKIMNDDKKLNFIKNCIICGKLFINNEENNVEMYNLLSRNMDILFHHSNFQKEFTNNNIFAISKNAKLLAITIDNNSVALYLNENSLNIANKKIKNSSNIIINGRLTYMTFYNDDEKLLLLKEDKDKNHLIIWNIFEDFGLEYEKIYSIDKKVQIIDLFDMIAFISDDSDDIRLLDEENIRKFEIKNNDKIQQEILEEQLSEKIIRNYNHEIKIMDDNLFDTEPWLDLDHYQTSYWLDYNKTTRISYGFYTVQIWKKHELIYIWSANYKNYNYDLLISNVELLDISRNEDGIIISKFKCIGIEYEIQVDNLVNYFFTKDHAIGAYNSLMFFYKLKSLEVSYKQHKIDEFIEKTKRIIYNIITKNPNLWRLLDVRYDLMENLIYSQSNDIIKLILNSTEKLHIPQLYGWDGNKRLKHELLIALENNNFEIVQQLLNYYSSNAMENTGWMTTLTRVLPEMSKKFPDDIVKLFKNPVFYQKQMHLTKSRIKSVLASNPSYDVFIVDTRLPLLTNKGFQSRTFSYKNSTYSNDYLNDNIKIHMIPLPDFSKYVEIIGLRRIVRSPFFELMSEKHSNLIYNNVTIEAIIKFHWDTHVFGSTLPKLILYVLYFISINVHLLFESFYPKYHYISKEYNIGGILASLQTLKSLNFMGSETKRSFYFYLFHAFNYVLLCLTLNLFDHYRNSTVTILLVTFTMLTLWVEFFFFSRIIPVVGEYILIIVFLVKKVIPYFLTLMIMIFGFGFSMFMIFSNATALGLNPDDSGYSGQSQISQMTFFKTLEVVYFWLFGNWDDIKNWNYFPIKILAILASFFLIIIMQNIFVALMTETISTAMNYSSIASLKSKADHIIQFYYQCYTSICYMGSPLYLSTESSFNFKFYHLPTFNSSYDRHIFYTINKNNMKNWVTIGSDSDDDYYYSDSNKEIVVASSSNSNNSKNDHKNVNIELIEKISDKQLFLENEFQKLNEKFDKLLELLSKK